MTPRRALAGLCLATLTATGLAPLPAPAQDLGMAMTAPLISLRPEARAVAAPVAERPAARWDDRAQGAVWTEAVLSAMRTAPLMPIPGNKSAISSPP